MSNIIKNLYAGEFSAELFRKKVAAAKGVMVLFGSCEQHGYHMPLDTDNIIGLELGTRIAALTDLILLPPINYGQVWSAHKFPGTIALSERTLEYLIRDILISVQRNSPRNIVLYSAHNGNFTCFKKVARNLKDEFDWNNIWYFPVEYSEKVLNLQESKSCDVSIHAGEIETSMLMAIRPDLVNLALSSNEFPVHLEDRNYRPIYWNEIIHSGSFGDNQFANAEKGRKILDIIVSETAEKINRLLK